MKHTRLASACLLALTIVAAGCRTARPAGVESPLQPVTAAGNAVVPELKAQLATIHAVRSLMRIHVVTSSQLPSFRAQVLVEPATRRMQLVAYTPLNTAAATITADGDHAVFLDHLHDTAWEGSASELAASIGVFDPNVGLAEWALDVAGFPAQGEFVAGNGGLARIDVADMNITFDPPTFPPKKVVVNSRSRQLEITHLEIVSTDADVPKPSIPKGYRCCVAPKL